MQLIVNGRRRTSALRMRPSHVAQEHLVRTFPPLALDPGKRRRRLGADEGQIVLDNLNHSAGVLNRPFPPPTYDGYCAGWSHLDRPAV